MRAVSAALEIADLIRRDGHRSYCVGADMADMYTATLCGVRGAFAGTGRVMAIKAYDLDVMVVSDAANMTLEFKKGDEATLMVWHRNLCAYRRSMVAAHSGRMMTPAAQSNIAA